MPPPSTQTETQVFSSIGRQITLYLGTQKRELTELTIRRRLRTRTAFALAGEMKLKKARRARWRLFDDNDWGTVVIDGWNHPGFDWLRRSLADAPSIEVAPGISYKMTSMTIAAGETPSKNKYELELEQYLRDIDPSKILFNNRK